MSGRCHKVSVGHWIRMQACRNDPRNVGHIYKEQRAYFFSNLGKRLKINRPRIGACPYDDHARLVFMGQLSHLIKINARGLSINSIRNKII
ncbi:hypothetical protein D3C77_217010 [compost metagenome]